MKDEESWCIAAVDAFNVADQKIKELTVKLNELDWDKKSARLPWKELRGRRRTNAYSFAKLRINYP